MLWPDVTEGIPSIIAMLYSDIVTLDNLYKPACSASRAIRKIASTAGWSTGRFLGPWVDELDKYERVILHANQINRTVPTYLRRVGYKGRVIYWYWNPVSHCVDPSTVDSESCELWSFDKSDCERYKMRFNTTYYFGRRSYETRDAKKTAFFIGRDKGRYIQLASLAKRLRGLGYAVDFNIIRDETSTKDGIYANPMGYEEVIQRMLEASAIVDVLQDEQLGLSLRPMEALYLGKKLLTTNVGIVDEPFYNKNNTYVLGSLDDNDDELGLFLESSYIAVPQQLRDYYDFSSWLERFQVR